MSRGAYASAYMEASEFHGAHTSSMVYQCELHDESDGSANAHRVPQQLFVYVGDLGVQLIEIQKRLSFVCGRGRRISTGGIGIRLVEERCVH